MDSPINSAYKCESADFQIKTYLIVILVTRKTKSFNFYMISEREDNELLQGRTNLGLSLGLVGLLDSK